MVKPSEWCREMYEKTLNLDYITLHNQWKERGL